MTFQEWRDRLLSLLNGRGTEGTRRPDGGTSCYRPTRKKQQQEDQPARGENPGQGEYRPQAERQPQEQGSVPYIHTGFTGMNPPQDFSGPVQQPSGPYFTHNDPPRDNISYMPGVYAPDAGSSFTHVEHIMTMTSLKSCYEAIECMKNGETLIITLDAIANEGESMRCQDMLAGAAFTLNCNVRMLQGGRLVLIAPESVKILPEQPQDRTELNPPGYTAPQSRPEPVYSGRRERRVSQQSAQWEAARSGQMPNYNPYTGTAPVAAGEYRSFGGYGY